MISKTKTKINTKSRDKKKLVEELWKKSKNGEYIPIEKILARSL